MQHRTSLSERPTDPSPAPTRDAESRDVHPAWHRVPASGGVESGSTPASSRLRTASERRATARVSLEMDVSLGADSHYFTAQSIDLSCGGLCVTTFRVLPDHELSIEFDLPAGRVVTKGFVRWAREAQDGMGPGYGIAFSELSRFDRTLIECFCRGLLASESCAMAG